MSRNFSEQEEHKIEPYILRALPKHTAVLTHSERGFKRILLPPWSRTEKFLHGFAGFFSESPLLVYFIRRPANITSNSLAI